MKCSRRREKKGIQRPDKEKTPRYRGLTKRGRGNLEGDRPPILGLIGRDSSQLRLQVIPDTAQATLSEQIESWTHGEAIIYTDSWSGYNNFSRSHEQVHHGEDEWARDKDNDDIFEIHVNTIEGCWAGLRAFLRTFKGVSKTYLQGYVAIYECWVNIGKVCPSFIQNLVGLHTDYT